MTLLPKDPFEFWWAGFKGLAFLWWCQEAAFRRHTGGNRKSWCRDRRGLKYIKLQILELKCKHFKSLHIHYRKRHFCSLTRVSVLQESCIVNLWNALRKTTVKPKERYPLPLVIGWQQSHIVVLLLLKFHCTSSPVTTIRVIIKCFLFSTVIKPPTN